MSKNYYLVRYKWGPGGVGFVISVKEDSSKVLVGKSHINKESDLELKVGNGEIFSISEDYEYKKIDKERAERLKRKEEFFKHIL